MSDSDRQPSDNWFKRDYKADRDRWQRRFRRTTRTALVARDWDQAESRWRRTSGWLSH